MENKTLGVIGVVVVLILAGAGIGYAVYSATKEYTVTFDYNYDTDSRTVSYNYKADSYIEDPAIPEVRTGGYYFVYWCADKECTKEVVFPYKLTGNVTFYAKWSTSIADKYFYQNYLTNTDSGKALVQSHKVTIGATELKIDGNVVNGSVVAVGTTFAILNTGSNEYTVINTLEMKKLFTIPTGGLQIRAFDFMESNTEFFYVQYNDGYHIYDLSGNSFGPASTMPIMALADTVLFDDSFYRFNSKGNLYKAFDYNADVYMPDGGNGKYFYNLKTVTDSSGNVKGFAINILDSNYKAVNTIKCSEPADYYSCTPLSNGKFLVQYAVEVPIDAKEYTFKDAITEKKYLMKTYIVDQNSANNKEVKMKMPVILTQDRYNSPGVEWEKFSNGTSALVQIGVVNNSSLLTSKVITAKISDDGRTVTRLFDISLGVVDTQTVDHMGDGTHYHAFIYGNIGGEKILDNMIVDGTGAQFKKVLCGVENTNGVKYFITAETKWIMETEETSGHWEKTFTDKNIYDINGNAVANYGDKEYVGASKNDLFFKDSSNYYIFKDGKMSTLCAYDAKKTIRIYDHCFSYFKDGHYIVCAENGDLISTSGDGIVSSYDTYDGHILITLKNTSNENKIFTLTTN